MHADNWSCSFELWCRRGLAIFDWRVCGISTGKWGSSSLLSVVAWQWFAILQCHGGRVLWDTWCRSARAFCTIGRLISYSGVWQICGNSFPKSASSSNSFSELILQNSHKNRAWLRPLRSVHLWVCEPNYRDVFEVRLELFETLLHWTVQSHFSLVALKTHYCTWHSWRSSFLSCLLISGFPTSTAFTGKYHQGSEDWKDLVITFLIQTRDVNHRPPPLCKYNSMDMIKFWWLHLGSIKGRDLSITKSGVKQVWNQIWDLCWLSLCVHTACSSWGMHFWSFLMLSAILVWDVCRIIELE